MKSLFYGERIYLCARRPEDARIMAKWTLDSEYMREVDSDYMRPKSEEDIIEDYKQYGTGTNTVDFRIRTLQGDQLIGFISIHSIEWNNQAGILSIGIGEPDFRSKGYGTEAIRLMLKYAFHELNLERVGLDVIASNLRAIHVYEKCGFVKEGTLRRAVSRDGKRIDCLVMGILKSEWLDKNSLP